MDPILRCEKPLELLTSSLILQCLLRSLAILDRQCLLARAHLELPSSCQARRLSKLHPELPNWEHQAPEEMRHCLSNNLLTCEAFQDLSFNLLHVTLRQKHSQMSPIQRLRVNRNPSLHDELHVKVPGDLR